MGPKPRISSLIGPVSWCTPGSISWEFYDSLPLFRFNTLPRNESVFLQLHVHGATQIPDGDDGNDGGQSRSSLGRPNASGAFLDSNNIPACWVLDEQSAVRR